MSYIKPVMAIAISAYLVSGVQSQPQPMVLVKTSDMPASVPKVENTKEVVNDKAVSTYHSLRENFSISHTEFAKWLGVKRRTMYNWLNDPASSTRYGSEIERRLLNLQKLSDEMEPEHRSILHKIAFSPIYGEPEFGKLIVTGAACAALESYYDECFSLFEDYRSSQV